MTLCTCPDGEACPIHCLSEPIEGTAAHYPVLVLPEPDDDLDELMRDWARGRPMILAHSLTVEFKNPDPRVIDLVFGQTPISRQEVPEKGQE